MMSNTGETNMSTISKNSLMYWLHKTHTTDEYRLLSDWEYGDIFDEDGNWVNYQKVPSPKPVDGCSWYRKGFLLLLLTTLLIAGGLVVSAICIYLAVNFLAFLLGGFVVFGWVSLEAAGFVLLAGTIGSIFYFIPTLIETINGTRPLFPEYISKHFPKKKDKPDEVKKVKQPSAVAQYYKAWKEKYCPVLVLEKEGD